MPAPNAVALTSDYKRLEGITDEAITPGMLVERGGAQEVQKHSVAGGVGGAFFALPNDLVGDGKDDEYAAGETVQFGAFRAGGKVYALLANGEDVAVGDYLESDGAGSLQATTTGGSPMCRALEAVDNSSGSPARIKVEVL